MTTKRRVVPSNHLNFLFSATVLLAIVSLLGVFYAQKCDFGKKPLTPIFSFPNLNQNQNHQNEIIISSSFEPLVQTPHSNFPCPHFNILPQQAMVLLTSYYSEKNDARRLEMENTLLENAATQEFSCVHIMVSPDMDKTYLSFLDASPKQMYQQVKTSWSNFTGTIQDFIYTKQRVVIAEVQHFAENDRFHTGSTAYLYSEFFEYANKFLWGCMVVISNGDIVFDKNSGDALRTRAEPLLRPSPYHVFQGNPRLALSLSRYNRPCPDNVCVHYVCRYSNCDDIGHSTDAFVFVSPVTDEVIATTNHPQNKKSSESLVLLSLRNHGYLLSNPCLEIRIFHNHCDRDLEGFLAAPQLIELNEAPCTFRICTLPRTQMGEFY